MKLKAKTKKAIRGSITLLMVIILLPMMTFSAVIVDTSRINMAKAMMSSAGDLTMNTALANYDTILKDVYGLFAMSQEKSEAELAEDLQKYFADTIAGYGVVSQAEAGEYVQNLIGDFTTLISGTEQYQSDPQNFLALENLKLDSVDRVDKSSLANPGILRHQIVEYMKFRAPLELGMSFLDSLKSFDVADEQMDVVETQVKAQENTQDVTSACKKLIDLIREYDTLAKANNHEIKGKTGSSDINTTVFLKDYSTHVNGYLATWSENYTHINKLLMVFLAKSPSTDSVLLVSMDYEGQVYFIKSNGLNYENCGISVTVNTKSQTADAKQDVLTQIGVVNGMKGTADTYKNKKFLVREHMNSDYTAFAQENNAVNSFIAYEQFLLDQNASVKYTDVENLLKNIYTLGKLYDHYYGKISEEITSAYNSWKKAEGEVTRLTGVIESNMTTMDETLTSLNTTATTFYENNKSLNCLKGNAQLQAKISQLLRIANPEIEDYATYYDNLKYGSTDKYLDGFKSIVNELSGKGKGNDKLIAAAAKSYIDNNKTSDFAAYVKAEVKKTNKLLDPTTTELFRVLNCLLDCSRKAQTINSASSAYSKAVADKALAEADVVKYQQIYKEKVAERTSVNQNYTDCLGKFVEFGKAYQRDAYYYGKYIATATAVVDRETAAIKKQFGDIVSNIKAQKEKLDAISKQCGDKNSTQSGTVYAEIKAYLDSVDDWEDKVDDYEKANGQDSFTQQARQDIATARSTYSISSLETLKAFVDDLYNRYSEFLTYLSEDVYFKYGGKRLHEIGNTTDAKQAAKHNIESITADVITLQIADTSLKQLYKDGPGTDFIPHTYEGTYSETDIATGAADSVGQLCFLEPQVLFIQFLKYLNSAYPKTATTTTVKEEDGTVVDVEKDYNSTKDKLKEPNKSVDDMGEQKPAESDKDQSSSGDKDKGDKESKDPKVDRYGYSYKDLLALTEDEKNALPSKAAGGKDKKENDAFKLEEKDGKVNASGSVGNQKSGLSGVLSGLGTALTAGLENAYVLTYIFENFSYNTLIQDMVMEGEKKELNKAEEGVTWNAAKNLLADSKVMEKYVGKSQTLSNMPKNAFNNYFYGAEVEYILYGNTNPSTNITYAKASIYAIRFAFNCIFAFTDTEIRNTTMSAGLAVQAATMGIVPYQVVQIVLQLALAAAESAVDLDMMMTGIDVAVVKTKDTWMLSVSNAVKSAGAFVAETAANCASNAIDKAKGGLQGLLDAGADEINGAITDLKDDLNNTVDEAVKNIADQIFGVVLTELENVLNEMQTIEEKAMEEFGDSYSKYVEDTFSKLKKTVNNKLEEQFGDNELSAEVLNKIRSKIVDKEGNTAIDKIIDQTKVEVMKYAKDLAPSQAVDAVIKDMTTIKISMVNAVTDVVESITGDVAQIATDAVTDIHDQLDNILKVKADELEKGVTEGIKNSISEATDDFVNNYLGDAVGSPKTGASTTSMASMIKFGYKEYLMLFVYIGICANGDNMLKRTADMIQLNMCHTGTKSDFTHLKGSAFRMADACTYVNITASAELDMFFVDLDMFASVLEDPTEPSADSSVTTEKSDTGTKIVYRGLLGY